MLARSSRTLIGSAWLLAACYSPETRDCTVSCTAATDCAADQQCGSDGFCAAPDVAGQCEAPDLVPKVALRITIDGPGTLSIDGIGVCGAAGMPRSECTWQVTPYASLSVVAMPLDADHSLDKWTTSNCEGQSLACTITPPAATTVGVKFRNSGD